MNQREMRDLAAATSDHLQPSNDVEFDREPQITVSEATERPSYLKCRNRQWQL